MTPEKQAEIVKALKFLQGITRKDWLIFMKTNEEKLPYFVADVSEKLMSVVRELEPHGFEIDR